jgi:hypothetical protein
LPATYEALALADAARAGQHQGPSQVGYAVGQHVRRIADLHAPPRGGVDVYGVIAHAPAADGLQVRQRLDHLRRASLAGGGDDGTHAFAVGSQGRRRIRLLPQFEYVVLGLEPLVRIGRPCDRAHLDDSVLGGHDMRG